MWEMGRDGQHLLSLQARSYFLLLYAFSSPVAGIRLSRQHLVSGARNDGSSPLEAERARLCGNVAVRAADPAEASALRCGREADAYHDYRARERRARVSLAWPSEA